MSIIRSFFILAFLSIAALAPSMNAQSEDPSVVHLDKSFYINGEVMWYKLYLPATFIDRNPAISVKLHNEAGRAVEHSYLRTDGNPYTEGYFKVPFDFPSGVYRLTFSGTDVDTKEEIRLAQVRLPIYNDDPTQAPTEVSEKPQPEESLSPVLRGLSVGVVLENATVTAGNEVKARIKVADANGNPVRANVSVSVTDAALNGEAVLGNSPVTEAGNISSRIVDGLENGLITRARLVDDSGNPLRANVLGVFSPEENEIYYTRSNDDGKIFLELPDFYGNKPIQFMAYQKEYDEISVESLEEDIKPLDEPLIYTEELLEYFELSRKRKKIYQYFKALEFSLNPQIAATERRNLKPNMTVDIQEYEPFENLATFFKEVLTPLRFRQEKDSTYYAVMYNPGDRRIDYYYEGRPLFIIDGKLTRNADFVARMPTDQIQTVDLYFDEDLLRRYFKVFGGSGVIRINTSIPDIEIPESDEADIFMVEGLLPPVDYPVFDPASASTGEQLPFLRPQLHWVPQVETDGKGSTTISFTQSDDLSTFMIRVVAQDENGRFGYGETTYSVTTNPSQE